jgi:hypothetical protein
VVDPKWLGPARDSAITGPGSSVHLAANSDLITTQTQSSSSRRDLNAEAREQATIPVPRFRLLARRLHDLGPRPLYEFLRELERGADLAAQLELYAPPHRLHRGAGRARHAPASPGGAAMSAEHEITEDEAFLAEAYDGPIDIKEFRAARALVAAGCPGASFEEGGIYSHMLATLAGVSRGAIIAAAFAENWGVTGDTDAFLIPPESAGRQQ